MVRVFDRLPAFRAHIGGRYGRTQRGAPNRATAHEGGGPGVHPKLKPTEAVAHALEPDSNAIGRWPLPSAQAEELLRQSQANSHRPQM